MADYILHDRQCGAHSDRGLAWQLAGEPQSLFAQPAHLCWQFGPLRPGVEWFNAHPVSGVAGDWRRAHYPHGHGLLGGGFSRTAAWSGYGILRYGLGLWAGSGACARRVCDGAPELAHGILHQCRAGPYLHRARAASDTKHPRGDPALSGPSWPAYPGGVPGQPADCPYPRTTVWLGYTLYPTSVAERSFSLLDHVQMCVKPMPQLLLRSSW